MALVSPLPPTPATPPSNEAPPKPIQNQIEELLSKAKWTRTHQEQWNHLTNHKALRPSDAMAWWDGVRTGTPREWWDKGYLDAGCQRCLKGSLGERVSSLINAIKSARPFAIVPSGIFLF